jgi:hypothetical protein
MYLKTMQTLIRDKINKYFYVFKNHANLDQRQATLTNMFIYLKNSARQLLHSLQTLFKDTIDNYFRC